MAQEAKKLVGVFLDQKTIDRVDGWAQRFGISRSKMAGILIEGCIENEAFLIDIASSPVGLKAASFFLGLGKKQKDQVPSTEAVPT